jgi:hypothetical protein
MTLHMGQRIGQKYEAVNRYIVSLQLSQDFGTFALAH